MKLFSFFFFMVGIMISTHIQTSDQTPKDVHTLAGAPTSLTLRDVLSGYTGRMLYGDEYPGKISELIHVFVETRDPKAQQSLLQSLSEKVAECNVTYADKKNSRR